MNVAMILAAALSALVVTLSVYLAYLTGSAYDSLPAMSE